jgi:SsrA-binding protein
VLAGTALADGAGRRRDRGKSPRRAARAGLADRASSPANRLSKKLPTAARLLVAENRKARHDYFIDDKFEAGIVLTGTEVKSMRAGHANIGDAYAVVKGRELFLVNCSIAEYAAASRFNHEPLRPRKLLLHRREISKLLGSLERGGMTLVPLSLFFDERGMAKAELGLARGKKQYDKRAAEKKREWDREKSRLLRAKG